MPQAQSNLHSSQVKPPLRTSQTSTPHKSNTTMSLFKSNKNKSVSAAASPAQSPRTSIDAQRPVIQGNTMTREQAIRLAMHNAQQKLPHHFSLL
ncbi:hypothetical protein EC957_009039 [Mortierella hygrophila]|uniref:Uncharacterized protein n=1 Tax=Mortierella hygrophila TaxID=979708 RepID=A0A9P6EX43_9FUNG|nr:hypothetical protein EC957_009039 [Mortierella hygrophila]